MQWHMNNLFSSDPHYNLEEYFAKKYSRKYIEFGGFFVLRPYHMYIGSPMHKYLSSGRYKKLEDSKLEQLWLVVRWREFYIKLFVISMLFISLISWLLQKTI